jgi:transposase
MPAPRKYPGELRERAVRLVRDVAAEDGSVAEACRRIGEQLGINADTLRGWVKRAQIDAGDRPGTTGAESVRIRQLERENGSCVRPTTAAGFFASMPG